MTASAQPAIPAPLREATYAICEALVSLSLDVEAERRRAAEEAGAVPPELTAFLERLCEAQFLLQTAARSKA